MKKIKYQVLFILVYALVKFLNFSYRYRWLNPEIQDNEIKNKGRYLFAIWHQNLLSGILCQNKYQHVCVVSQSKDGEFVARILQKLGHLDVRGSSTRGGLAAKSDMEQTINSKNLPGAITVDGPLGPAHVVKKGIIEIARNTQSNIIPYVTYPSSFWSFDKAWDQFRFPKPFSKIAIWYGEPISIPKDLQREDFEKYCELIKNKIHEGEKICSNYFKS